MWAGEFLLLRCFVQLKARHRGDREALGDGVRNDGLSTFDVGGLFEWVPDGND